MAKQRNRISYHDEMAHALAASFDLARVSGVNENHWANADGLSADAAMSPSVRRIVRNKCIHEVANNSWLRGIVETLANDVIGTGPRLQSLLDSRDENRRIETLFHRWTMATRLAKKLRVGYKGKLQCGEAIGVQFTNPVLRTPIKLDVCMVESARLATPDLLLPRANEVDGIKFDAYGNPKSYSILDAHPGSLQPTMSMSATDYPASSVMHWFREDRAGQHRGLPEVMAALELLAVLRRYTFATVTAAETAANLAGILKTDTAPEESGDMATPYEEIDIVANTLTVMPDGYSMQQFKAEQPTATYVEARNAVLLEAVRCILIPWNIAAGDSSNYNFASGRLDHKTYWGMIGVVRSDCELEMVEPVFESWNQEAALLGLAPDDLPHKWMWPGMIPGDEKKAAEAQEVRLRVHTTTYSDEYGKMGLDWEEQFRQIADEKRLMNELGLTVEDVAPAEVPDHEHEDDDE